jgi:hypothetical protein
MHAPPEVTEPAAAPEPADHPGRAPEAADRPGRLRTGLAWTATVLAILVVWLALVAPNRLDRLSVGALLRIPVEGLIVVGVGLLLPPRARRIMAALVGTLLGVLVIANVLDMGFIAALDRPFNPVTDLVYFGPAAGVLNDSVGPVWTVIVVVAALLLLASIPVVLALAVVRLTSFAARHRTTSVRTVAGLAAAWLMCAVVGVQFAAHEPVASRSAADLAYNHARAVDTAFRDQHTFKAALSAKDAFAIKPGKDLLTGLRGKDVIVAFVESYGRVAVQGTSFSKPVDAVLNAGTEKLRAAGYSTRSAFLTSPTFGGISWLAHSTFQSGLWIDNQRRYNDLVGSSRFTLSDAFKRAGWRTVGDVPSDKGNWPQGKSFYHYDQIYNASNVGYHGPKFSYAAMPDQYILSAFQRMELAKPHHTPVMAEIDLVSSHTPWAPLPRMVPWDQVGDGSIFNGMPAQGQSPKAVWRHASQVQAAYGQSVQYSLTALTSFVQTFHDPNLVLVVLGDHQPATIVSGSNPGHDVPITIIAHDPRVMDQIASWGWQDGMLPSPSAPVWPMDVFRNRLLTAFGPHAPVEPGTGRAR